VLVLLRTGRLEIWHLYVINALNGLMNTVQRPAHDVVVSLLTPRAHYQRASAVNSMLTSVVNILTPALATALLTLAGLEVVIAFDLLTFTAAFIVLLVIFLVPEGVLVRLLENVLYGLIGRIGFLTAIPVSLYLFIIHAFSGKRPVRMRTFSLLVFILICGCIGALQIWSSNRAEKERGY
jgi:uncharacterized membrane protein